METILGCLVILLVAGIMMYMQFTSKQPSKPPKISDAEIFALNQEAIVKVMSLYETLKEAGYLEDEGQKQRFVTALSLLSDIQTEFAPEKLRR